MHERNHNSTVLGMNDTEGLKWDTSQTQHPNPVYATHGNTKVRWPPLSSAPGLDDLSGLLTTATRGFCQTSRQQFFIPSKRFSPFALLSYIAPVTLMKRFPRVMRWPQGCPAARSHPANGASTVCLALTG